MDGETEEVPAGSPQREPTLPLPEQRESPRRRRVFRGLRKAPLLWAAVALVLVVGAFLGGWTLGRTAEPPEPRPRRIEAAPPPPRLARYCGRALDVSARLVQIYRDALENRIAAAEAALADDVGVLQRLDGQLRAMTGAADRLERRVTRALATCPS